jgi:translocator protein
MAVAHSNPARTAAPVSAGPWHTVAFVTLVVVAGSAVGFMTGPDAWYDALSKPSFQPPNWLFAPVWTALYVLVGIAGARTWWRAPASASMALWALQLGLNLAWSPVFFAMRRPDLALGLIVALWATIAAFVATRWKADPPSSVAFLPYLAWVSFATVLNGSIVALNP